ncbi:MAG TPA: phage holin family protein [Candidatus Limnocylindria bacterium]|nr:phage holin family protein [Candidatus Limnocylindria bacterium]
MTSGPAPRRENAFTLVRRLVAGTVSLAKLEVEQAKAELKEMTDEAKIGASLIGVAVAIALMCLITLDVAIILAVAALFEAIPDLAVVIVMAAVIVILLLLYVPLGLGKLLGAIPGFFRAVLVLVFLLLVALFLVPSFLGFQAAWLTALFVLLVQVALIPLVAVRGVRRIHIGPPERTIASVKEDVAWLKSRVLRRS